MANTCVTASLAKGYPTSIVAHATHGSLHLRPEGTFLPLCGMRKGLKETGLKSDEWRKAKGNYCAQCERAAKFFGYLE